MEELKTYELKLSFQASESNANAFYQALAQIAEAWSRHQRLQSTSLNLKATASEDPSGNSRI